MQFYYFNLPKDWQLDFNKNIQVSNSIASTAKKALEPFETYLQNSISAIQRKEHIKAKWKKIETNNLAELFLIGKLYEIPKHTIVKIDENIAKKIHKDSIIMGSANIHRVISVNNGDIILDVLPIENEMLFWNNSPIHYEVISPEKPNGIIIHEDENRFIVYSEKGTKPCSDATEIPYKNIVSFIDFENLKLENGQAIQITRNENLSINITDETYLNKTIISNNLKLKIEKIKKSSKDAFWIQLLELDDNANDDIPGFSPLKYFFDDDIEIEDNKKNKYSIAAGIESENKLVLKKKNENGKWEFTYPDDGSILTVKVNIYPLQKQIEAISTLLRMPIGEHSNLIKLFEKRDKVKWHEPTNQIIDKWFVITDDKRSGSNEQRDFIQKAINTPDFAILEGPLGSGKTTVILELICQLAKQGKRVLLCGSTHVAIDNVLERLKEKKKGTNLLEQFHILPVRIGDEQRISEDIKEFQIDNLIEDHKIEQELLLDISNLVCGTTIGILQHPKFKKRKGTLKKDEKDGKLKYYTAEPIIPEFDYLIIDECSKTTFQEFLVPALYAKKWILVGDVMQLSPFTEREEIVSNIEQLSIYGSPVPIHLQQACFYIHKLKDCLHNKNNKFVFPADFQVLNRVIDELIKRIPNQKIFEDNILFFVLNEDHASKFEDFNNVFFRNVKNVTKLELAAADLIFIESNLLEKNLNLIPESHAVLRSTKWEESEHAFTHNVYQQQHSFQHKEKGREFENSFDIVESVNTHFVEKSWAEEIAWRIDREHQIRLTQNSKQKGNYEKVIQELLPKSFDKESLEFDKESLEFDKESLEKNINLVASIAFPSILESLVKGYIGRKFHFESTISEGFTDLELQYRKTILRYQHRMHPDISKFPRQRFYQYEDALKDLENPIPIQNLRQWDYSKYPKRSVWIDVKGKTDRNKNREEVKTLNSHLKQFIEFAQNNPQLEGKEWTVACLTFYRGQETLLREELQKLTGNENGYSNFNITNGKHRINIKLHTVDKFQGHEADIVFLSMVQTNRDGFLDNPNRLNVAITRAKFQLVIIGSYDYFKNLSKSEDLKELAKNTYKL